MCAGPGSLPPFSNGNLVGDGSSLELALSLLTKDSLLRACVCLDQMLYIYDTFQGPEIPVECYHKELVCQPWHHFSVHLLPSSYFGVCWNLKTMKTFQCTKLIRDVTHLAKLRCSQHGRQSHLILLLRKANQFHELKPTVFCTLFFRIPPVYFCIWNAKTFGYSILSGKVCALSFDLRYWFTSHSRLSCKQERNFIHGIVSYFFYPPCCLSPSRASGFCCKLQQQEARAAFAKTSA